MQKTMVSNGVKDDSGKTPWWYMDRFWVQLEDVVQVLDMGNKKYPAEDGANWLRVEDSERRYKDAMLRHMLSYRQGEKIDPESNKSHLAHVITNAFFLMYNDRQEDTKETWDLPTLEKLEQFVLEVEDNCTNYSSPTGRDHDRQIIQPHLDVILDEIQGMKDETN